MDQFNSRDNEEDIFAIVRQSKVGGAEDIGDVGGCPDLHGFEAGKRMNTKNTEVETKNTRGKRAKRGDNSRSLQGRIAR